MNSLEYVIHGQLAMARGSVLRIEDGPGIVLHVWEGSLWVTQEGDPRDHYLQAGDWFALDRDGAAVISVLSRAVISVTAPQAEYAARRVTLTRTGTYSPVQLYPTAQPGTVARLLSKLGMAYAGQSA